MTHVVDGGPAGGGWEVGHVNLHPFQAPAAGAGACGPGSERGAPPAALLDLPAQGREGPDHCGLCPGGHLSGQPPSGSAGRGGERRLGRVGGQGRKCRKAVFTLLYLSFGTALGSWGTRECVFSLEEEPEGQRVSECLEILPTGAGEMAQKMKHLL